MGRLIIIEGGDGSGKATQTALLKERLQQEGYKVKSVSFPNYDSPAAMPVKMYLAGDFGKNPSDINPFVASSLYAVDRFASFRMEWQAFYEAGGIILADRYTTSNMVHQMVKYDDEAERNSVCRDPMWFACWICRLRSVKHSWPSENTKPAVLPVIFTNEIMRISAVFMPLMMN